MGSENKEILGGEFIASLRSAVVLDNGPWCDELLGRVSDRASAAKAASEEMPLAIVLGNPGAILALARHGGFAGPDEVKLAIESGRAESLSALEQAGADMMGGVGEFGQTPLMFAASVGSEEVFRWLLQRVDIGARDEKGLSASDHVLSQKLFDSSHWVYQWALAEKSKEELEGELGDEGVGRPSRLSL